MGYNCLWDLQHYDNLVQVIQDSIYAREHGTCDKMLDDTVIVVCELQHTWSMQLIPWTRAGLKSLGGFTAQQILLTLIHNISSSHDVSP
jgi:hypothetical protein